MDFWYDNAHFYQFYPMGFAGAPVENGWDDSNLWNGALPSCNRLEKKIREGNWIEHLKKLSVDAVYFSPVFQSDKHGYDTRDYYTIDSRLGSNEDFAVLCDAFHKNDIRVVLDGVFNHVGRGFWAFKDVLKNREHSRYKDWFFIDWSRNSNYNDGFFYEGWEGHFDLVSLNLENHEVVDHLFGAIEKWVELFHIDGIRLDVAYCLNDSFLKKLRSFCDTLFENGKGSFLGGPLCLIGEVIYADGISKVSKEMLSSCTNYECYKGLWSSLNDKNFFEIAHSLKRFFSPGGLAFNKQLLSFVDNHDVSRLSSALYSKELLSLAYAFLYGMPGTPCLYYGSEWALSGDKKEGDEALRPELFTPSWNFLTDFIAKLSFLHTSKKALYKGLYEQIFITNEQFIFKRFMDGEKTIIIALNASHNDYTAHPKGCSTDGGYESFDGIHGRWKNLFTNDEENFCGSFYFPALSAGYFEEV